MKGLYPRSFLLALSLIPLTMLGSCGREGRIVFASNPNPDSRFYNEELVGDSRLLSNLLRLWQGEIVDSISATSSQLRMVVRILTSASKHYLTDTFKSVATSLTPFFASAKGLISELGAISRWYKNRLVKGAGKLGEANPLSLLTPFKELVLASEQLIKEGKGEGVPSRISQLRGLITQFMILLYGRLKGVVIDLKPAIDSWNVAVSKRVKELSDKGQGITNDLSYVKRISFKRFEDNVNPDNIHYFSSLLIDQPLQLVNIANLTNIEISDYLYLTSLLATPLLANIETSGLFKDKLKISFLLLNSQAINLHQFLANIQARLAFFTPLPTEQFTQINSAFQTLLTHLRGRLALANNFVANHERIEGYLERYGSINQDQLRRFKEINSGSDALTPEVLERRFKYKGNSDLANFLEKIGKGDVDSFFKNDEVVLLGKDEAVNLGKGESVSSLRELFNQVGVNITKLQSLIGLGSGSSLHEGFKRFKGLLYYLRDFSLKDIYTYFQSYEDATKRLDSGLALIDSYFDTFKGVVNLVTKSLQDFFTLILAMRLLVRECPIEQGLAKMLTSFITTYSAYKDLLSKGSGAAEEGRKDGLTPLDYLKDKDNLLVWLSDLRLALFALSSSLRYLALPLLESKEEG